MLPMLPPVRPGGETFTIGGVYFAIVLMFAHKIALFSVIVGFNLDSQAVNYDDITETNI